MTVINIVGIDTGIGKTIATGLLGKYLLKCGKNVITQKLVQTGCKDGRSEDILAHRQLMGIGWNDFDQQGITCPYIFPFPASPHLAAELAGISIQPAKLRIATETLALEYEIVIVEGSGGLLVPLTRETTLLDYFVQYSDPMILVTSSRLGSINHTLLSLLEIHRHSIDLKGIVYAIDDASPSEIVQDTRYVICRFLADYFPDAWVTDMEREESGSYTATFGTL